MLKKWACILKHCWWSNLVKSLSSRTTDIPSMVSIFRLWISFPMSRSTWGFRFSMFWIFDTILKVPAQPGTQYSEASILRPRKRLRSRNQRGSKISSAHSPADNVEKTFLKGPKGEKVKQAVCSLWLARESGWTVVRIFHSLLANERSEMGHVTF